MGGGAFVLSASAAAALAMPARAETLPDADLAYLRVLIGAELLEADFAAKAAASGKLRRASAAVVHKTVADEKAHYGRLAAAMTAAGQVPATAADIDFAYPKGAFVGQASILKVAAELASLTLGTYLGAVENVQTPDLRLPIAQIAANEAQHLGALASLAGRSAIGPPFAPSLQIDAATVALDAFES